MTLSACERDELPWPMTFSAPQEMDELVANRGVPVRVDEQFVRYPARRYTISLWYPNNYYTYETNEDKSYTTLISQVTHTDVLEQQPIPAWFKERYPELAWSGIPTY